MWCSEGGVWEGNCRLWCPWDGNIVRSSLICQRKVQELAVESFLDIWVYDWIDRRCFQGRIGPGTFIAIFQSPLLLPLGVWFQISCKLCERVSMQFQVGPKCLVFHFLISFIRVCAAAKFAMCGVCKRASWKRACWYPLV
jgi:hypothetical protein